MSEEVSMQHMLGVKRKSIESGQVARSGETLMIAPGDAVQIVVDSHEVLWPFQSVLVAARSDVLASFRIREMVVEHGGERRRIDEVEIGRWSKVGSGDLDVFTDVEVTLENVGLVPRALRCIIWMRDRRGCLWGEAVGWGDHDGAVEFAAWQSGNEKD